MCCDTVHIQIHNKHTMTNPNTSHVCTLHMLYSMGVIHICSLTYYMDTLYTHPMLTDLAHTTHTCPHSICTRCRQQPCTSRHLPHTLLTCLQHSLYALHTPHTPPSSCPKGYVLGKSFSPPTLCPSCPTLHSGPAPLYRDSPALDLAVSPDEPESLLSNHRLQGGQARGLPPRLCTSAQRWCLASPRLEPGSLQCPGPVGHTAGHCPSHHRRLILMSGRPLVEQMT